jgi:endogenous inhibitor of DNA gyrase (YacG/DUF329 family)
VSCVVIRKHAGRGETSMTRVVESLGTARYGIVRMCSMYVCADVCMSVDVGERLQGSNAVSVEQFSKKKKRKHRKQDTEKEKGRREEER